MLVAHEWSSEAASRAICPNSLRHCCISEETGGWLVYDRTDTLVGREEYGVSTIGQRRCLDASVTLHVSEPYKSTGRI